MHTFSHWRLCLNQPQWGQENNLLFIFHCFHADTAVSPRVKWTFIQQIWICKLKSESWCIYSCCYRLVMHCVTVFELSFCGCALCSVSQLYTLLLCWVLWSGPRTASKYFFKAEARKAAPVCLKINPSTAWFFFKSKLIQLKRYKKQQIKEKKKGSLLYHSQYNKEVWLSASFWHMLFFLCSPSQFTDALHWWFSLQKWITKGIL